MIKRVAFHNTGVDQQPGLIIMSINNGQGLPDIDSTLDAMVIAINATPEIKTFDIGFSGFKLSNQYRSDLAKGQKWMEIY